MPGLLLLVHDGITPASALKSPVFLRYAAIVAGLLVASGVLIFALRRRGGAGVEHARKAWASWLLMAPLVVLAVFLGRVPAIVFFAGLSLLGVKEFARATGLYRDWPMTGVVYLGVLSLMVVSIVSEPAGQGPGWYQLFVVLPVYVIPAVLMVPIVRNRVEGQLQSISLAAIAFVYVGWMFGHLGFLANADHAYGYLLYLVFAVEVNDVAAFAVGRTWGRHPLRSRISPNKTWEGSLGALAVSMALPWALRFSFPHFGTTELILAGVIVGVGGQLGDLSMGVIKRDLGIKDTGAVLPGHGGVLDRINSLIFTAPLFFHMARYFHDIY